MSEIPKTEFLPFELMIEHDAKEWIEHIRDTYGNNPHVIFANLDRILQEFGHNCFELGGELSRGFPSTGAADLFEAFIAGMEYGRIRGDNE